MTTKIVVCCNAVENFVLPMMIFKRKKKKLSLTDYAPSETLNELTEMIESMQQALWLIYNIL